MMKPWMGIAVTVCIAATAFLTVVVPVRRSASWCDPVSGSIKHQTTWPFGITMGPSYEASPLEMRLHAIGYAWTPRWQFLSNDHYTLLGRPVKFECGSAPAIYSIRTALGDFARTATPGELREFADVMQNGSEGECRSAVNAAGERALAVDAMGG